MPDIDMQREPTYQREWQHHDECCECEDENGDDSSNKDRQLEQDAPKLP
jgi:hypothetical protein